MHTKILILSFLVTLVSCRDVSVGTDKEGHKIFDEIRQANPAIWRQIENVTIIAPNDELINGVVITDMRPEKDGDVQIVDGGEGKKSVTIELRSPSVLRGYEFHLEVYTVPETKFSDAEEGLSEPTMTTEKPDKDITPTEGSGEINNSELSESNEKTTEMAESTTVQIPALVGQTIVDGDILSKSRQTLDDTKSKSDEDEEINSEESDEPDSTTTEKEENPKETTTEAETSTTTEESMTFSPETFDNNKNTPDYPALSILDLIKNKEGARRIRHTDDESVESSDETTESMNQTDIALDLVPPVETEYNTGFSDDKEPIGNVENKRSGRYLDESELSTTESTEDATENETTTTTESTEEQARNARHATDVENSENENNDSNNMESDENQNQAPLCPANEDKPQNNVIIINGDKLTLTPDSQLQFGIPIVLIIGSETGIPTIKIIAEDSSDDENKSQEGNSISEAVNDFKSDYPQDKDMNDDDFIPRPIMSY